MMRPLIVASALASLAVFCNVAIAPALAERSNPYGGFVKTYTPDFNKKTNFNIRKPVKPEAPAAKAPPPAPQVTEPVVVQEVSPPEAPQGNLVYKPEKLEPLFAAKLSDPAPVDAIPAAIYSVLLNRLTPIQTSAADRKAIIEQYQATGFKPIWTDDNGITPRGQELLAALAASSADGMDPNDYLPPTLGSFADNPTMNRGDAVRLATTDLAITAMALKYARHASGGRLIPNRLTTYNDIKPPYVDPAIAMKVLASSPFPASYLSSLQPRHPAFAAFKTALARLRENNAADLQPIAAGSRVRPGESDARIPKIRAWLSRIGYLTSLEPAESSETTSSIDTPAASSDDVLFDEQLAAAVKAFQSDAGIKSTGYLDKQTVAALNKRNPQSDEMRLLANMERLRWLPRDLGSRYVFVNQAAFRLQVVDNGQEVWTTKVVIGKPDTQTAAFHDQMETIVFNPSWGVPESIITKEMLPELRKDASYLDRQGFRVIDKSGKVVRSSSVNWYAYGDKPPFDIQQPPSDDNALGDVKFLFPNAHSIYMHDTPTKQFFARSMRAFSHGCVRVENPREFAAILLGESREKIDSEIDGGVSHSVPVAGGVKVHITYFTAWPDKDGRIVHYNDVYNRDGGIISQFTAIAVAAK